MKTITSPVTVVTNTHPTTPVMIKVGSKVSVPPSGQNLGRFVNTVISSERNPNGEETSYVSLVMELDAKDTKGSPFIVTKKYKNMANGNHFLRRDLRIWAGEDIMPDGGDFNIATIIGKPVLVEIENRWTGRRATTVVKALLPAPQPVEQEALQASA